jgi:hypothetical protein
MLAVLVLALAGITMLGYAIFGLVGGPGSGLAGAATDVPTMLAAIPTTTPRPPDTATPEPTATVPPAETQPPAEEATATPGPSLTVSLPANVRSGPGTSYGILGGLNVGTTAVPVGRDASADWFAIPYSLAPGGTGWISSLVVTYAGDVNALPLVAAGPPPPTSGAAGTTVAAATATPAATTAAATNTPVPMGSRGIVATLFTVENTTAPAGEQIWFNFSVVNRSAADVAYSVLAAHTDAGFTAQSWTNETLKAGETLTWRDNIRIGTAGTYQLYLGICYGGREACLAGSAAWERLSNNITVTVQ